MPCTCESSTEEHTAACAKRKPEYPAEKVARYRELTEQLTNLNEDELQPALIRWGVKALRGIVIDGNPDLAGFRGRDVDVLDPQHLRSPDLMKTNDACHGS